MEISKKKLVAVVLITAFAFSAFGFLANPVYVHFNPQVNVYMKVIKGEGSGVSATLASGNLITDIGENFIGNCTLGLDANGTWAISLSNVGSPAVAWTELNTEVAANGFTRAEGTLTRWVNGGDYAFNVTKTFTATGTQQLQTAGLQWDDTAESDNNLLAAATFTQTTFETDDTLTVTWVITFNAN